MYFKNFDTISYDLTTFNDKEPQVISILDLTTRIALEMTEAEIDAITDKYLIREGETPEILAYKLYKTPLYHWVILYINNITNVNTEWPLDSAALSEFILRNYEDPNEVHHYEKMPEGLRMDESFIIEHYGANSVKVVTNAEFEENNNEAKRYIKVIKPEYIGGFVSKFMSEIIND